ncbi:MAG: hypothetical protein WCK67_08235 [bacterium]
MNLIWALMGYLVTIIIQALGVSAVLSSSIAGVIASCLAIALKDNKNYSASAFCGSFAGMTSLSLIFGKENNIFSKKCMLLTLLLGFILSFVYFFISKLNSKNKFSKYLFNGYGGRLGAIAFISVLIFIILKSFLLNEFSFLPIQKNITETNCFLLIFITCIGAFATSRLSNLSVFIKNSNYKILIPALLSFLAYIIFCNFSANSAIFSQAFYAGTFVGMSSIDLLPKKGTIFAGTLTGIILTFAENIFKGVGGKLGFTAFIAVLITIVMKELYAKFSLLK